MNQRNIRAARCALLDGSTGSVRQAASRLLEVLICFSPGQQRNGFSPSGEMTFQQYSTGKHLPARATESSGALCGAHNTAARYSCTSVCFCSFPLDIPPTFQFPTFDPLFDPALFGFTASEFNTLIPLPSDPALDELMSLWEGSGTFPQPDVDASAFDHLLLLPPPPPESPPPKALAVEQPEPGPSAPKSRRGPRQEVDVSFILPTDSKRVRGPSELERRMDGDEISDRVQKRAK
ncbi:hypothetical protein C8J57DRAFT_1222263 [Mycena rebaudengoi]|nr:hypothetical protein C8J57DRAFT_1222263 [Mycena rebaudengoi]